MKLKQYQQILSISKSNLSEIKKQIESISIYLGIDSKIVGQYKIDELTKHYNNLLNEIEDDTIINNITISGIEFNLIDFNYTVLKEFITLNKLFNDNNNISRILAIFYRPVIKKGDKIFPDIIEEFNGRNCEHRHCLFDDVDFRLINVIKLYEKFVIKITTSYTTIFPQNIEDDKIDWDLLSPIERKQVEQELLFKKIESKYSWDINLLYISESHLDSIILMEKPLIWILNKLTFIHFQNSNKNQ